MKNLLLSFVVLSFLSICNAKAQLIISSQGIVKEHIEIVEPEPEPESAPELEPSPQQITEITTIKYEYLPPVKETKNHLRKGSKVDLSYYAGVGFDSTFSIGGMFSVGYMVIPSHLYTGIGVGLGYEEEFNYYIQCTESYFDLPIFGHLRYYILNKQITPFVDVKGGYNPTVDALVFESGVGVTLGNLYFSTSFAVLGSEWEAGLMLHLGYTF